MSPERGLMDDLIKDYQKITGEFIPHIDQH